MNPTGKNNGHPFFGGEEGGGGGREREKNI